MFLSFDHSNVTTLFQGAFILSFQLVLVTQSLVEFLFCFGDSHLCTFKDLLVSAQLESFGELGHLPSL
jgi:hypothetical protein